MFNSPFPANLFCLVVLLTACNGNQKASTPLPVVKDTVKPTALQTGIPGSFSSQNDITFDSANIAYFLKDFPQYTIFQADLLKFYRGRGYTCAWYDDKGLIETASNLFNRVQNVVEEGIQDSLPYKTAFANMMETEQGATQVSPTLELMLTSQYLMYAKKVWIGLSEQQTLASEWLLPRKKITTAQLLDSLLNNRKVLATGPVYRQYGLLKDYLKKYNDLKTTNDFTPIRADKKTYKLADSSGTVAALRQRLFLLGDIDSDNHSAVFDESLQAAVKNFERRMGAKEDGIVNQSLINEMNYPLDKRIQQILVNMERSRWVPVQPGNDYLVVNIPEFKLHVYENNDLAWSMNVVVGKSQNKTVIFNGDMKYVVFSPYWNIPTSILKKEVLPGIKRNKNYLANHNMEWNGGAVRQKPGINNSLGLVKFLFPNSHAIYLHDTPAKSLFNEDNRAFSHGCIRLNEPKRLALYLLRNDPAWDDKTVTAAMNKGVEKTVTLKTPVPVFITYFTAWVDRQGKLNFRNDVYQRNSRLAKMILKNPLI